MHIDDDELLSLVKGGAKIHRSSALPALHQEAPKPSEASLIVDAIQKLSSALSGAANRPDPAIKVEAPNVTVRPNVNVEAPKTFRKWSVKITERDNTPEQRMKSLTIEAIE